MDEHDGSGEDQIQIQTLAHTHTHPTHTTRHQFPTDPIKAKINWQTKFFFKHQKKLVFFSKFSILKSEINYD